MFGSSLLRLALVATLYVASQCNGQSLNDMAASDMSQWIGSIGYPQYAAAFVENQIDGSAARSLTASDLEAIGVNALGHRKRILKAISSLSTTSKSTSSSSSSRVTCTLGSNGESACGGSNGVWIGVRHPDEVGGLSNWYEEPYPHPLDTDRCNMDRIPLTEMTNAKFRAEYYLKKPFILVPTDAQSSATTLRVRREWSRAQVLENYGDIPVNLGTPHSLTAYGDGVISTTLGDYIADLRNTSVDRLSADHYLFDRRGFFKQASGLLDSYQPHPLFHWGTTNGEFDYADAMTFGLGPTGSGINFHYHKSAWNEVLFGRKRWFLYPPTVGSPPRGYNQFETAMVWYQRHYASLSEDELPIECIQYPGEVMYIPEDWYHATVNIGETIAAVGQAHQPAEGTMMYYVLAALAAGDHNDKVAALRLFNKALVVAPNHPQVYNYIGNLHKNEDRIEIAQEFYRKAVQSNPQYSMAWLSLGQSLITTQDYSEAYDALYQSYQLNPLYFETSLELGNVCYYGGAIEDAVEWLSRAITLGKADKRTNAFINLCSMYIALEEYDSCIALAESRLAKFDREWYIWTVYAQALSKIGRIDEAKAVLRDVLHRNGGKFPPADQVLGQIDAMAESNIKKRGLQEPSDKDREEIAGIEAKLKLFHSKANEEPAWSPNSKSEPAANVQVQIEEETYEVSSQSLQSAADQTRTLKLVTGYQLSELFPSFIRKIRFASPFFTYPPVLTDPVLPTFVGGTAESRKRRQAECKRYLETRVTSAPFSVLVWNTWMKSTSGRLFGELEFHEITANEASRRSLDLGRKIDGRDEESVVFVGWDGLVATPELLFTYEQFCVAGTSCTVEEMESMRLLTIDSYQGEKKTASVQGLAVLTGAVFAAQASRVQNPQDFGLGIKVDHVAKNMNLFKKSAQTPAVISADAQVYPLPIHADLASLKLDCRSIVRHHYSELIVIDQFMTGVNFAHFVTEILPKLSYILDSGLLARYPNAKLVLQNQSFIPEVLTALNVSSDRVIYVHPCVLLSAERVIQTTPSPLDLPTKETIGMIRKVLQLPDGRGERVHVFDQSAEEKRKMGKTDAERAAKRALLSSTEPIVLSLFRPYPLTRSISNSAEVEAAVKALFPTLPFVSFDPEFYTFNEAVTLFSRASIVVGVIGAGFANLAFAPLNQPPLVIQLVPTLTHHRIPCGVTPWWHYTELIGAPTRFLTIEDMGFDESNWAVPVKELKKLMEQHTSLVSQ